MTELRLIHSKITSKCNKKLPKHAFCGQLLWSTFVEMASIRDRFPENEVSLEWWRLSCQLLFYDSDKPNVQQPRQTPRTLMMVLVVSSGIQPGTITITIISIKAGQVPAQKMNSKYKTTNNNEPSVIKLQHFKQAPN